MFQFDDRKLRYKNDYPKLIKELTSLREKGDDKSAVRVLALISHYCKNDLFFLMYFVLEIKVINESWIVDRIREVEEKSADTIDLWAREHFKSTILTYGLVIQEIIRNPEERICIFSHTRAQAKAFLRRLKHTFEDNPMLITVFRDIFYENTKSSPKWSEDDGLIVKRKGKFNEATIEAWGLIDGSPVGKHYTIRVYDDMVTETSVNTPDQMKKLKDAFDLSHNLGARGGSMRVIGTIYHFMDLHNEMVDSGEYIVRKYPAEDKDGNGVFLTNEELRVKLARMGSWVYSAQMMLDPVAKGSNMFDIKDLQYYETEPPIINKVVVVDPANSKKSYSDSTVIACIGQDTFRNHYLIDMVRDKLELAQRWEALSQFMLNNSCNIVYYEKHGSGWTDIQYFREKMGQTGIYFTIVPISNQLESKANRIQKLQPILEEKRLYLPHAINYRDVDGKMVDLVHDFIVDELDKFPFCKHDDMLDCIASSKNPDVIFRAPQVIKKISNQKKWNPLADKPSTTWMAY